APILITTPEKRMAGPTMNQQQMIEREANAPMTNAGLAMIQVKAQGSDLSAMMCSDPFDPQAEQLVWPDFQDFENVNLRPGTRAAKMCWGEVEVNGGVQQAAWANVSGAYQAPSELAKQLDLPPNLFWKFVGREKLPEIPDHAHLEFLRGGNALQLPAATATAHSGAGEARVAADGSIDRALHMIGDSLKSESRADEGPPEWRQKTSADFVKSLLFASTAGSSGGGSAAPGMARPAEAPEAPAAVGAVARDPVETAREIMGMVATDFEDLPKDMKILLGLVRYLSEAPISDCALSNRRRLIMILIVEGDRRRAHSKKCFYCAGGCWGQVEAFDVKGWGYLAALEGVFTKIGGAGVDDYKRPDWKWSALQGVVGQMLRLGAATLAALRWKGNWALRAVDMVFTFKAVVGRGATRTPLAVPFLKTRDAPEPRPQGVTFADCYLDSNWDVSPPHPDHNCYMRVLCRFFLSDGDINAAGIDVAKWGEQLSLELAPLKLTFLRVNSAKMNFKIGRGGDGQHAGATLQRNLVGEASAHYLDCSVFYDRSERRKSGGLAAWNKSIVRIQECDANAHMVSDSWKRSIVGEELSRRVNYRFPVQRTFGECERGQGLNGENVPVLEETGTSRKKSRQQLERRITCSRMGKATFVRDEEDARREEGRCSFKYLRPFAKKCAGRESLVMLGDIVALSTEMYRDLAWLASRLSGGVDPRLEGDQPTDAVERNLIASPHMSTPMKAVVKARRIENVDCAPGARKPGKKGASKRQSSTAATGKSSLRRFSQCGTNALRKLMVHSEKMVQTGVFGDREDWGNSSDDIDDTAMLIADGSVDWYRMVSEPLSTSVTPLDSFSKTKTSCAHIARCLAHYNTVERTVTLPIDYYIPDPCGRSLCRGVGGQKFTREARGVASPDCVESDSPRCHPRSFMKALQARGLWTDDRFPMIHKSCAEHKKWRETTATHLEISTDEAKG
ncbi:unnamed protein product, partial [Prorocentrum cordatum]